MTSDAKIGLLLGLIFIFVIAFIINGLPNLRPQATKGEAAPGNAMPTQDENLGVADSVKKAQETMQWSELLNRQTDEPSGPVTATKSVELTTTPTTDSPAAETARDIHSILPMPSADGIEKLTKGLEDIVQTLAQASAPGTQGKTTEPAPSVDVTKQQAKPEPERTQAADSTKSAKPAGSAPTGATRTYTVVDGDNLASIAKKVYGPEEGNRIINNQRIFEANRNILKTADDVAVGQELVIPPPAKPKPKPDTVLPKTLFEKVEAIGKRAVPAPGKSEAAKQAAPKKEPAKPATAPATSERWYVVQDGDNLWKIASSQLGSGARYEEIAKLNADILKGDIKVNGGMRLRLPSQ